MERPTLETLLPGDAVRFCVDRNSPAGVPPEWIPAHLIDIDRDTQVASLALIDGGFRNEVEYWTATEAEPRNNVGTWKLQQE